MGTPCLMEWLTPGKLDHRKEHLHRKGLEVVVDEVMYKWSSFEFKKQWSCVSSGRGNIKSMIDGIRTISGSMTSTSPL
jgi:hexokinase